MEPALVDSLHRAVGEAVKRQEYQASVRVFAVTPVVSAPKQFGQFVASEIARYRKELAPLNIQLD
jgi:tripartite-type tricarboxylate transporter receptor subunit TctC